MGEVKLSAAAELRLVKQRVLSLLERYPETRSNDHVLLVRYWNEYDRLAFDFSFPTQFIERGTPPESITRARRAIQATGLFPAAPRVKVQRQEKEQAVREVYRV